MNFVCFCLSMSVFWVLIDSCLTFSDVDYGTYESGKCPAQHNILRHFVSISIRACVKKCATRSNCTYAGYEPNIKLCTLHFGTYEEDPNCGNSTWILVKMETVNVVKFTEGSQCSDGEVYDAVSKRCTTEECPPFPDVTRGQVLGNMATLGSWRVVKCDRGFSLSQADRRIQCQKSFQWSPIPKCVRDISNIALNKHANMSSESGDPTRTPSRGVDGNTNQDLIDGKSCFHTGGESNPWWYVDFGAEYCLLNATLYNRNDNNKGERAHDVIINIGITYNSLIEVDKIPQLPSVYNVVFLNNTTAQFLKVSINSSSTDAKDFLHLCEVQVFGYLAPCD